MAVPQKVALVMMFIVLSSGCSWARINFPPQSYDDRGMVYGFIAVAGDGEHLSSLKFVQIEPDAPKDIYFAEVFPYRTHEGKPGFVFAQTYIADGATVSLTRIFGNGSWGDMYKGKFDPMKADPAWTFNVNADNPNYIGELSYSATLKKFSLVRHQGRPRVNAIDLLQFLRDKYSSTPDVVAKIDGELKRMR